MNIRPAGLVDSAEIADLDAAIFKHSISEPTVWHFLHKSGNYGIVARKGRTVCGFALFYKRGGGVVDTVKPPLITIVRAAVAHKFWRQGIGSALFWSISRNNRTQLEVGERELNTQLFLRAIGFRAVKIKDKFFSDGQAAYVFRYTPDSRVEHEQSIGILRR
jgi:ribosomal protein S18 acetylase RimI-like enzyme